MYKKKTKFQKLVIHILMVVLFCQFTNISAFAIPIKEHGNTPSLSRDFKKPLPEIPQKEKSERAKKILKGDLIQPHAVRELNHTLKSIREIIGRIEDTINEGKDPAIHIKYLQAKYESLKDLDKQVRNNLRIGQNRLKEQKAPGAVQERGANLLAHYEKNIAPILNRLETILIRDTDAYKKGSLEIKIGTDFLVSVREFKDYFDANVTLEAGKPKPAPSPPSFRPSNFKPLKPDTSGRVEPAYLLQKPKETIKIVPKKSPQAAPQTLSSASERGTVAGGEIGILSVPPPDPEDTEETIDVVITQEMRDLVASLNNSPARIFEWVKNNVEVEFYYGSMKGSRGAFIEKAGNDIDTVSLLLALYRAAGIPCRYVTGTIELPIEKAKNLTGVDDPQKLGDLIASAGIPSVLIVSGDEVVAVRMEHTWAEALVDYDPYAGAKAGEGDLWVPLSPWYKAYEYDNGVDLVTMSGFDSGNFLDGFISDVKPESPVDLYKIYFEDYLKANSPGMNWQDGLRTRELKPEKFRTLPNTLNFEVVSINGEYAELPDNLRHKVTLEVPDVALSYTLNLSEVVGKKVTYSYPPADQASKDLIDSSGGIENVDPLAVNLLPSVKIEGVTVATGSVVNAGYYHTLRTTFDVPGQSSDFVEYSVISGAYYAVGLDPQFVSNKFLADRIAQYISTVGDTPEDTDNMDEITGEALYLAAMKYFNDCNAGDTVFAQSLKDVFLKQTSGSITGKGLVVYTLFGTPSELDSGGYFVDAKRNIYTPISVSGDEARELDFMILGGYNGSFHEHNLFEEFFHLEAISTVKLLSLASEQGMPIYDIDSTNIDTILPLLGVDASVKSAIQTAVGSGHVVKIHQDTLTVKDWSGAGYVDRDPTTNAAGYMISGGLAGGQTTSTDTDDADQGPGTQPGQENVNDPVNPATGNLLTTEEDFTVPARGMPISFVRYNSSQSNYDGPFGYGWTFTYDETVIENPDESLTYVKGNGTRHNYTKNPDGTYNRPPGMYTSITKTAAGFTLREKHGIQHLFDLSGRLTSIVGRNGNTILFSYTGDNLTQITDTVGRTYSIIYNVDDRIESVTINVPAPGPYTWTYTYNGNDLESVTGPNGYPRAYTYYADHNLSTLTNQKGGTYAYDYYSDDRVHTNPLPNGGSYIYSYNFPLRITTCTDPENHTSNYYYDKTGAITGIMDAYGYEELYELDADKTKVKITDKNGGITKNAHDAMGNILTTTNQLNYTTTYTYESTYNQIESVEDPRGRITYLYYDINGNLERIRDALTHETINTYDASNGDFLTSTNAIGVTTYFAYNPYGYLIEKRNVLGPDNIITSFTYDDVGNLKSITDPENNTTTYSYQNFNQLKEVIVNHAGTNYITSYEYDENGNREAVIDAKGNRIEFAYNEHNKLKSIKDALNNITSFVYDMNGNTKTVTDAELKETTNYYNMLNRLIALEDALGNVTQYEYDAAGNQAAIIDARGNKTQYEYDSLKRLVRRTYPDASTESYAYDKIGNIVSKITRTGDEIKYDYDALNRLDMKTYQDATTVDYAYDNIGRLISVVDSDSSVTYEYDDLNRVISTVQNGNTIEYEYDKTGNRTKLIYPDSDYVTYEHDDLNRLDLIRNSASDVIANYDYDELNRRVQLDLLDGTQARYSYDEISRLINLTNRVVSTSAIISSFDYTYDKVINRKTMTTIEGVHSYTHDDVYQLIQVTYPDGSSMRYNLDKCGNRSFTAGPETVNYTVNKLNQYTYANELSYSYDGNGNMTNDGFNSYYYDCENRLIQVTTPLDTITYAYDALGRRIAESDPSSTTRFIYDGDQVIIETDGSGTVGAKYVHGVGIDETLAMIRVSDIYLYHYDGLGSVSDLTDSNGNSVESYSYDAYGIPNVTTSVGNPYMFTGRRLDGNTGLYYFRARYYNPILGRFLQAEPLGYLGGINVYTYAINNPTTYKDPYANWAFVDDFLAIGIGTVVGLGSQLVSDLATSAIQGELTFSDWQSYVSSGVGGAVAGELALYTGGVLSGAGGALTSNLTEQLLRNGGDVTNIDVGSLVLDTGTGALFGKLGESLKVPGITKGRGSWSSTYEQIVTKLDRKLIKNVSANTLAKMVGSEFIDSLMNLPLEIAADMIEERLTKYGIPINK
jgi:RHS repeat-associated protein